MRSLRQLLALTAFAALTPVTSFASTPLPAESKLDIELTLPDIATVSYKRPYVAVWLENDQRKAVATLEFWAAEDDWYKDLRAWWRKAGRYLGEEADGISSATRPAGVHRFSWKPSEVELPAGDYQLHIEVSREHGGRSHLRQAITLGQQAFEHSQTNADQREIGPTRIRFTP